MNKTRYAILGMLLDGPCSGYDIKGFMTRSTAYFWRETDSTIYPMLKVLAKEGKVRSKVVHVGKKKKEVFSITKTGRGEFENWIKSPTSSEIPRNEFLLKLFFVEDEKEMVRLCEERLEKARTTHEEFKKIEERLKKLGDFPKKAIRLKLLRYGIGELEREIKWLKDAHH